LSVALLDFDFGLGSSAMPFIHDAIGAVNANNDQAPDSCGTATAKRIHTHFRKRIHTQETQAWVMTNKKCGSYFWLSSHLRVVCSCSATTEYPALFSANKNHATHSWNTGTDLRA